jgi:hypothetical protein
MSNDNDLPYTVDEKALAKLQAWLDEKGDAIFRATKIARHREGQSSWIPVGDVYVGDAIFAAHPWTGEKCMSFGRGFKSDRMWTSAAISAEPGEDSDTWLLRTYNSIYKIELYKRRPE